MRREIAVLSLALCAGLAWGAPSKYVEDFEFLEKTVAEHAAAPRTKGIDWAAECARLRPLFESCTDDVEHVRNVMRMVLALVVVDGLSQTEVAELLGVAEGTVWSRYARARVALAREFEVRGLAPEDSG
jgi:DNA-directed RNA polymerase specialized sigma24 family protein